MLHLVMTIFNSNVLDGRYLHSRTCIPEPAFPNYILTLPPFLLPLAVTGFIGKTPSWENTYDTAIPGCHPTFTSSRRILHIQTEVLDVPAIAICR